MSLRISSSLRPLAALGALALLPTPQLSAQTIYLGGMDTLFMEGDPVAGNFQFLGACGGQIACMIESFEDLYLGDVGGRVYQYFGRDSHPNTGVTTYLFDSPNDSTALADYGGTLLVGGSDGSVHSIDKRDGSVEESFDATRPVGAMLRIGRDLFVGSPTFDVMRIDLQTGATSLHGVCGGQIHAMTLDDDHFVFGTPSGVIYRMDVASGIVDAAFLVPNDATALAMHAGDLLVGGSDGSVLRMNPVDGTPLATLNSAGNDVSAMAMAPDVAAPGWTYCYGLDCPCGNEDPVGGCANSLGEGARMLGSGTNSVLADDLVLTADRLPPNVSSVNYMGSILNDLPFGDGKLCTGGGYPIFRYRLQNAGPEGVVTSVPGLVAHSKENFAGGGGQILPGTTWIWQIWYRNPPGPCGSGFNTSNAYLVSFVP